MSNLTNDRLYDRAAELLPYLTPQTAFELNEYIEQNDLAAAYYFLELLEAKYADDQRP